MKMHTIQGVHASIVGLRGTNVYGSEKDED